MWLAKVRVYCKPPSCSQSHTQPRPALFGLQVSCLAVFLLLPGGPRLCQPLCQGKQALSVWAGACESWVRLLPEGAGGPPAAK